MLYLCGCIHPAPENELLKEETLRRSVGIPEPWLSQTQLQEIQSYACNYRMDFETVIIGKIPFTHTHKATEQVYMYTEKQNFQQHPGTFAHFLKYTDNAEQHWGDVTHLFELSPGCSWWVQIEVFPAYKSKVENLLQTGTCGLSMTHTKNAKGIRIPLEVALCEVPARACCQVYCWGSLDTIKNYIRYLMWNPIKHDPTEKHRLALNMSSSTTEKQPPSGTEEQPVSEYDRLQQIILNTDNPEERKQAFEKIKLFQTSLMQDNDRYQQQLKEAQDSRTAAVTSQEKNLFEKLKELGVLPDGLDTSTDHRPSGFQGMEKYGQLVSACSAALEGNDRPAKRSRVPVDNVLNQVSQQVPATDTSPPSNTGILADRFNAFMNRPFA